MYRIEALQGGEWLPLHGEGCLGEHLAEARLVQSANAIGSLTLKVLPTSSAEISCNTRVRALNERTGKWEFYGRVIDVTPQMEDGGELSCEVTCEDALGFLQDTRVWIDSRKAYFEGQNKSYWVEVNDDETRTMYSADLVKLVIGQHNNTVGDSHGDKWKRVAFGDRGIDPDEQTSMEAEYEATTYEMLADIADDSDLEYRSVYDGTSVTVEVADSLGAARGTFAVGDNLASSALKTSMADVATRMFPYGDEYAKLEKRARKGTKVTGALKGGDWQTKKGTMVRFDVEGALKCVLTVGARNKDYAMVFFTDRKITAKNAGDAVIKKYATKAKATGDNLTRRYPVPEDAKYAYVYGSDSKCTTYGYYTNGSGAYIKRHYRTDLGWWKKKLTDKQLNRILKKYGCEVGSVVDGSGDRSYFLRRNEDRYGVVEGTCIKEGQLATSKIENAKKAVYSIDDLKATRAKAERFVKFACRQLKKRCKASVELTVTGYDLAEAGLGYDSLELYDTWTVRNELAGINHKAEVVRIERDLLHPWEVEVEMGSKVTRASGSNRPNSLDSGGASAAGDDDDSAADEYAALAGQYAAAAEAAAKEAVEKADEFDGISYRIQVDSLAAGQMASEAYDSVHPITEAMRGALEEAEEQASQLTAVKEAQSQTIEVSNSLARAVATYSYETERSVVRWKQTYTAALDAWASEDDETQAKIKAAYAKLYGEGGTADNPTADSAQGHLNAAKAANVEAAGTEAQMRTELASANAYQASCKSAASKAQASYEKALANYKALKKRTTAKRKQLDASHTALKAAQAKRDRSQAAVDGAKERCEEAEANYAAAKEALADAEAKVAAASAEVDTAMNGIHELYSSTIEQTARGIKLTAERTDSLGTRVGSLEVTADDITSTVSGLKSATNLRQTESGWTWAIVDGTARSAAAAAQSAAEDAASDASSAYTMAYNIVNGTGTLTLGGQATAINMGGSSTTITMGGSYSSINMGAARISYYGGGLSIKPRGDASNVGLYLTSSSLSIGNSSSMNTGKLECGNIESVGKVTADKYESTGSYMNVNIGPLVSGGASCGSKTYKWSSIYAESDTIQTSSRRVKENIEPEPDEKAARLLDIDVVKFDYKPGFLKSVGCKGWYGVIAEDVHDAFPEVVSDWGVGTVTDDLTGEEVECYPGVTYGAFVPHLIKLCQMQQRQIDALAAKVAELEGDEAACGSPT